MKLKYLFIAIAPVAMLFTSCLKAHNSLDVLNDKGGIVTSIQDVARYGSVKFYGLDLPPLAPPTEVIDLLTLKVYAPRDVKPNGTVHVKLVADPAALAAQGFTALPTNAYTPFPLEYDIPAGGEVNISTTITKSNLNAALTYGFAFKISEVSQGIISANDKEIVIGVGLKNKYDGEYTVTGTMVDYSNPALTGPYPWDVYLITTGPSQVILFDNVYTGDIFHWIKNGTSDSYYGAFGLVINFDANDNVTSVTNYWGQPSSNGRSAELDPSGINKFNPATRQLDIKYWMNQPSVITPHRTSFDEHFTYVGPRP